MTRSLGKCAVFLGAFFAASCDRGGAALFSKSNTNGASGAEVQAKKDDGKRPTEQSEGLVGYLVDPDKVSSSVVGEDVAIIGTAGALSPIGGVPDAAGARYSVWAVDPTAIAAAQGAPTAPTDLPAIKISSGMAGDAAGSFSLSIARTALPANLDLVLTFNAPQQSGDATISFADLLGADVLYKSPDTAGVFSVFHWPDAAAQASEIDAAVEKGGPPLALWSCTPPGSSASRKFRYDLQNFDPRYSKGYTVYLRPAVDHCTYVDIAVKIVQKSRAVEVPLNCADKSCAGTSFRMQVLSHESWHFEANSFAGLGASNGQDYQLEVSATGGGTCNGPFNSYGVAASFSLGAAPAAPQSKDQACADYVTK